MVVAGDDGELLKMVPRMTVPRWKYVRDHAEEDWAPTHFIYFYVYFFFYFFFYFVFFTFFVFFAMFYVDMDIIIFINKFFCIFL